MILYRISRKQYDTVLGHRVESPPCWCLVCDTGKLDTQETYTEALFSITCLFGRIFTEARLGNNEPCNNEPCNNEVRLHWPCAAFHST